MSKIDSIIAYGLAEVGKPYIYGAEGPNAFDCSGLMQYIFAKSGVSLPRTAAQQQKVATPVSAPRIGDLVFWGAPADHVALYVGDNRVLSAPQPGENVRVQSIWGSPTYGRIAGAGTPAGPVVSTVGNVASTVGLSLTDFLGGFRDKAIVLLVATAGLALLGLGAWRITT